MSLCSEGVRLGSMITLLLDFSTGSVSDGRRHMLTRLKGGVLGSAWVRARRQHGVSSCHQPPEIAKKQYGATAPYIHPNLTNAARQTESRDVQKYAL
jgi:hypothetical protein